MAAALVGIGFALPAAAADTSQPGRAKDTYSTVPDKATPKSDNEAGPQSPPEHSSVTPPAGSNVARNPKAPKSPNESDAHPESDTTNKGATSGSTGMGKTRRSPDREMNR